MIPYESDPEILEHLYERFGYWHGYPHDARYTGTLGLADQPVFPLVNEDDC